MYDPALEYTPQFYTPERGDVILNPLDARSPVLESRRRIASRGRGAHARDVALSRSANENPFFTEGPRRIFAHLLTFRPTAEELASWLCHEEELDRRLHGTPYASMIDRQAPAQRSGVLAALNMVADTLKLLPARSGDDHTLERRGVGARPAGVAVPHEHAGDPRRVSCRSRACGSTCSCCG